MRAQKINKIMTLEEYNKMTEDEFEAHLESVREKDRAISNLNK